MFQLCYKGQVRRSLKDIIAIIYSGNKVLRVSRPTEPKSIINFITSVATTYILGTKAEVIYDVLEDGLKVRKSD